MNIFQNKIFLFTTIFFLYFSSSFSANTHFIDFSKVLNQSKAGSQMQAKLKKKFEGESNKFKQQEKNIRKEESDLIPQKKILTKEEYQKKIEILRKKVAKLQEDRKKSLTGIAKSRNEAKKSLLKAINPIMKKYMEDNKIGIVVEKKSVVLGDATLELTDKIIALLNKELPSLN
jgi:Skp family chaperone for outer membrane proteins